MINKIDKEILYTNKVYGSIPKILCKLFADTTYPWEAIPKINAYIKELIPCLLDMGYAEYQADVWIGKDTYVSPKSEFIGPAVIGHRCEIRPGAYIRGNVITGDNCVIGNSTEVKNSVLFDNVQVPHYNYLGDSILGNYSHLGAGAVCSNQKQDKGIISIKSNDNICTGLKKLGAVIADRVEVGCGCVLNPGTVILEGTRIYPLTSVRGVLPDHSIMKSSDTIIKIELP